MTTLYCDGASRGNPGPGAYGFVIFGPDKKVLYEGKEALGEVTNNVAEYQGVIAGLRKCQELGIREIQIRSDSELLVKQLRGEYRIKATHLLPLVATVRELLRHFQTYKIEHVRREENKLADQLANSALDALREGNNNP